MSKKIIRVGDSTDHGGKVLASGAPYYTVQRIAVALKGDPVSCPRPGHHNCVIAEGDEQHTIGGVPVAYEGHAVSCGAKLIATEPQFTKG